MNSEIPVKMKEKTDAGQRLSCCLKSWLLLTIASCCFRVYILSVENLFSFSSLALRGVFDDLTIPFAVMALAIYSGNHKFYKLSHYVNLAAALLVCFDFKHFVQFVSRINLDILNLDIFLYWLRSSRGFFIPLLLAFAAVHKFLSRKITGSCTPALMPRRAGIFLAIALLLITIQNLSSDSLPELINDEWDRYLATTASLNRCHLASSSFHCLFSLTLSSQAITPPQIFWESSFPEKFLAQFEDFAARKQTFLTLEQKDKLWLHQGFHESGKEGNSIKSVNRAFASNYAGVEIDLHFVENEHMIIVCHDMPTPKDWQNNILTFDRLLQELPLNQKNPGYLWLDFKNLNSGNASEALNLLAEMIRRHNLHDHVLVESSNPFMVRKITQAGLNSVWGVFYGQNAAKLDKDNISAIKALAVLSQCIMISLPWQACDEQARNLLNNFPTAVYTVNDIDQIEKFLALPSVKIVLTDLTDFKPENEEY